MIKCLGVPASLSDRTWLIYDNKHVAHLHVFLPLSEILILKGLVQYSEWWYIC